MSGTLGPGPDSIASHRQRRFLQACCFQSAPSSGSLLSCSFLQKEPPVCGSLGSCSWGCPGRETWGKAVVQGEDTSPPSCLGLHQTLFEKAARSPTGAETISSLWHSQLSSLHAGLLSSMQPSLPEGEIGTQLGNVELAGGVQ